MNSSTVTLESPSPLSDGCVHHWLIGAPKVAYSQPGMKGDLVERTDQRCKKCNAVRTNAIVLPAEQVI